MRNSICLSGLLLYAGAAFGQTVDPSIYAGDAFRYSEITQTGTARFQGLGGNHAALGGDASSTFGNPAGLGFYNRSEFSISPALNLINTQSSYIGSVRSDNKANPTLGHLGLVLASSQQNGSRRWRRSTLGITYSRLANFNNQFSFGARNNRSSIADTYVNAANGRQISPGNLSNEYDQNNNQALSLEAAAYQSYIIDATETSPGQFGLPYYRFDAGRSIDQFNTFTSSGGLSQWTIAYAGNLDDKLYIGGSIGLTRLRYTTENVFSESPIGSTNTSSYNQTDNLSVRGNGINFTLGAIYKLDPSFQLGLSVATPTFSGVRETFSQSITANILPSPNVPIQGVNTFPVAPNDFNYSLTTPFRSSLGATYFIGGGKVGFITATADYVGYGGLRVSTNVYDAQNNSLFKSDVKQVVQSTYNNVINLRAGAEFRAGLLRIRGGVAYLPDPYQEAYRDLDRSKLLVSAGLGVRSTKFFADVSGTYNTFQSSYTPYTLPSTSDYASALITNKLTNITLTVGTFF